MNDLIETHREHGVLTLTFNRPDKLNALNNRMYTQLTELLLAADEDHETGVIIITGGPSCFSSGNDLEDFLQHPPIDLTSPAFRLMDAVIHLSKPLLAAVCGMAIGIGTTLLLHCDQVLVSRDARLRLPFVNLGLCPEFGASLLLPARIGHVRAARMLFLGDSLDGDTAVKYGLANEAFDTAQECLAATRTIARRLLALPRESLLQTKALLKRGSIVELRSAIEQENVIFIERVKSKDAQAALHAMLNRKK